MLLAMIMGMFKAIECSDYGLKQGDKVRFTKMQLVHTNRFELVFKVSNTESIKEGEEATVVGTDDGGITVTIGEKVMIDGKGGRTYNNFNVRHDKIKKI